MRPWFGLTYLALGGWGMTALYTYSLEIYPTCVRSLGFGIVTSLGRVSSLAASFVMAEVKLRVSGVEDKEYTDRISTHEK